MRKAIALIMAFSVCFVFASCKRQSAEEKPTTTAVNGDLTVKTRTSTQQTTDLTVTVTHQEETTQKNSNKTQNNSTTKTTKRASQTHAGAKPNATETPTAAPWQPENVTYYALSDIKWKTSENITGLNLCGISVEKYHLSGYAFLLTLINVSDKEYAMKSYRYFSTTYSAELERQNNGQWQKISPVESIADDKLSVLHKNTSYSVTVNVNHYFSDLENGRYRLTLPVYENEEIVGNISVEFTGTKFNAVTARAGTKVEDAVSVTVSPFYSGYKYVVTPMAENEKNRIVELYNGFDFSETSKPENLSVIDAEICDRKGNLHRFSVYSDGTVAQNNSYFKTENGKEMYDLLYGIIVG